MHNETCINTEKVVPNQEHPAKSPYPAPTTEAPWDNHAGKARGSSNTQDKNSSFGRFYSPRSVTTQLAEQLREITQSKPNPQVKKQSAHLNSPILLTAIIQYTHHCGENFEVVPGAMRDAVRVAERALLGLLHLRSLRSDAVNGALTTGCHGLWSCDVALHHGAKRCAWRLPLVSLRALDGSRQEKRVVLHVPG